MPALRDNGRGLIVAVGEARLLRDDLMLGESPRWHDGRLYVSDLCAHEVVAVDLGGVTRATRRGFDQASGSLPLGA